MIKWINWQKAFSCWTDTLSKAIVTITVPTVGVWRERAQMLLAMLQCPLRSHKGVSPASAVTPLVTNNHVGHGSPFSTKLSWITMKKILGQTFLKSTLYSVTCLNQPSLAVSRMQAELSVWLWLHITSLEATFRVIVKSLMFMMTSSIYWVYITCLHHANRGTPSMSFNAHNNPRR